jgi:predicted RNA polymerase sigma factor
MAGAVENAHKAAERVARESYGRLLAFLAVRTRDVAGAEDALADAFAAALRTWPDRGVPANPAAWLLPRRATVRPMPRDGARHKRWVKSICSSWPRK